MPPEIRVSIKQYLAIQSECSAIEAWVLAYTEGPVPPEHPERFAERYRRLGELLKSIGVPVAPIGTSPDAGRALTLRKS